MANPLTLLIFLSLSMATVLFAHSPPSVGLGSNEFAGISTLAQADLTASANQKGLAAISIQAQAKVAAGIAIDISKSIKLGVNDKALSQCFNGFEHTIKQLDISLIAKDVKVIIETLRSMNKVVAHTVRCTKGCKEVNGEVKRQIIHKLENFKLQCSITLDLAKNF